MKTSFIISGRKIKSLSGLFTFSMLSAVPFCTKAQSLYNNGASLTISSGANMYTSGNLINNTGSITNYGMLSVKGNVTNNAVINAPAGSTLQLTGNTAQSLTGSSPVTASNVIVNNPAGITLNTSLRINGTCTFTSGNILAATVSAPIIFSSGSTVVNASDASHVNGYVVKEGTGIFDYPVGDAVDYQRISTNLSANASGMRVRYIAADAGSGTFTSAGTEATPLVSYNNNEYWDLTPLTSATGTVTVFWDGYKDAFANPISQRRLAHKSGVNWQNEGSAASVTGTATAGSVTGNSISSWSPFALGSVTTVLPVKWLSISGKLISQKQALITWKVQEENVNRYEVQCAAVGNNFVTLGNLVSMGNGENGYAYTDNNPMIPTGFYRIAQIDKDGRVSFSNTIRLQNNNDGISTFPNPVVDNLRIIVPASLLHSTASLTDNTGKTLRNFNINSTTFNTDLSNLPAGNYYLKFADGSIRKITKQIH